MSPTPLDDSKRFQLRVRVSEEDHAFLENRRHDRGKGETISDLVREGIHLLRQQKEGESATLLPEKTQSKVEHLAQLLQREPHQVEEACVEGIFDLIEEKAQIPLIVMETHLYLKYRGRDEHQPFPWNGPVGDKLSPRLRPS